MIMRTSEHRGYLPKGKSFIEQLTDGMQILYMSRHEALHDRVAKDQFSTRPIIMWAWVFACSRRMFYRCQDINIPRQPTMTKYGSPHCMKEKGPIFKVEL